MDDPKYPNGSTSTTKPVSSEDKKLLITLKTTPITYNPQQQSVVASVDGNQLNLLYNEKAELLIDADRYKSAWYIVFKEDFSNTQFADFNFTSELAWGAIAENWTPDNLKQMQHTETDTIIAGVKVVNVKFNRVFKFHKAYQTSEEATSKLASIVGKQEPIKFLTRYQPDADTTHYDVTTVNVAYTK